jgi:hypothetical protein
MRKRGMPSGDAVALCFTEPEGFPFPRSSHFNRVIEYAEAAMSEVKSVAVSVSSPSPADPAGRAIVGFYVIEGDVLTMTDGDGKPVRRRHSGELYKHKLVEGDDPVVIAKRLIWPSGAATQVEMRPAGSTGS